MRRILACSLLLAACQPHAPAAVHPSARATTSVTAASTIPLPAPRMLQRPANGVGALSGTVKLDAGYIVASGGGNLITNDGATVLAAGGGAIISTNGGAIVATGGGNIISGNGSAVISGNGSAATGNGGNGNGNGGNGSGVISGNGSSVISGNGSSVISGNGSSVISGNGSAVISGNGSAVTPGTRAGIISGNGSAIISTHGGGIVATGGGNVISGNGSAIVASGAGNIVATGGGNIVATGGGNIVASGGGNIVATGGGNLARARHVLDQPSGSLVPVAGMPIGLFSLATHKEIPVGVDEDKNPVFTVYTDLKGGYELYPPATEAGNILVVAHVDPQSQDPRYHLGLVTPMRTGADLDEDSSALTTLIRKSFVKRLERILVAKDEELDGITKDLLGEFPDLPANFSAPLADMVSAMHANATSAKLVGLKPEDVQPLAQRVADLMVRELTLNADAQDAIQIVTGPSQAEAYFPAMLRALQRCREGAAQHDAAYFAAQPYFQLVQEQRKAAGLPAYAIQKPADLNAFVTDEYFGEPDPRLLAEKAAPAATQDLFGILDLVMRSVGVADQTQTVRYAHNALLTGLMFKFVEGSGCDTSLRHRVGDMIRGGLSGSPPPVPTVTCPPD